MDNQDTSTALFKTPSLEMGLEVAFVAAVAAVLILSAHRLLPWIGNRLQGRRRLSMLALVPVLRLLVIVAAFTLIVPVVVNPSLQNMVALLGTVGLALGFALKDLASSLIAGVVVVGERPYRNGDWIEIDGIYGEVRHVGMRTVRIVTPDDTAVTIPHSRIWTHAIFNANDGSPRLQCVAEFHLHPLHDAAQVRQVLTDVALTSPYLHFDEPVAVIVRNEPWGCLYRLKAYPIDARQQFRFLSDLSVRGHAALSGHAVQFTVAPVPVTGKTT